jgi:hypothetical protein
MEIYQVPVHDDLLTSSHGLRRLGGCLEQLVLDPLVGQPGTRGHFASLLGGGLGNSLLDSLGNSLLDSLGNGLLGLADRLSLANRLSLADRLGLADATLAANGLALSRLGFADRLGLARGAAQTRKKFGGFSLARALGSGALLGNKPFLGGGLDRTLRGGALRALDGAGLAGLGLADSFFGGFDSALLGRNLANRALLGGSLANRALLGGSLLDAGLSGFGTVPDTLSKKNNTTIRQKRCSNPYCAISKKPTHRMLMSGVFVFVYLGDSGLAGDLAPAPLGVHLDTCAYTRLRFDVDTQRQRGGRKGQDQHSNVDGLSVKTTR